MIPANPTALSVVQGGQSTTNAAAQGKPDVAVSGQSKASAGVAAPSNVKAQTAQAIDPSRQSTATPRLRDQESADRSPRTGPTGDGPTGPPPSFDETPLQRAARVIFEPPEAFPDVAAGIDAEIASVEPDTGPNEDVPSLEPETPTDAGPRPEPRPDPEPRADESAREARREAAARQAEAAFEEAQKLAAQEDASGIDVSV